MNFLVKGFQFGLGSFVAIYFSLVAVGITSSWVAPYNDCDAGGKKAEQSEEIEVSE